MKKTIGSHMKLCATCSNWCGRQEPNISKTSVSYDDQEKAKCVYYGMTKTGTMSACYKWEQRFK